MALYRPNNWFCLLAHCGTSRPWRTFPESSGELRSGDSVGLGGEGKARLWGTESKGQAVAGSWRKALFALRRLVRGAAAAWSAGRPRGPGAGAVVSLSPRHGLAALAPVSVFKGPLR